MIKFGSDLAIGVYDMAKKRKAKKSKVKRKRTVKKSKPQKSNAKKLKKPPTSNVDALTPVASDEALERAAKRVHCVVRMNLKKLSYL
jgi:hypothetical protein